MKENNMSLDEQHKGTIIAVVRNLIALLDALEGIPVDPRALDLMEIGASLLEQQVKENAIYEICDNHNMESDEEFHFFEDGPIGETQNKVEALKFLNEHFDMPSADELEDWFNIPSEFNEL